MKALEKVQQVYDREARFYDFTRQFTLLYGNRAVKQLHCQPGDRVLEVGCGTGRHLQKINQLLQEQGSLTGIDLSAGMLQKAKEKFEKQPHVTLLQADAARHVYEGTFNKVLFADALSMIPDYQPAIDRVLEALAPGGRIVVLDFKTSARPFFRGMNKAWVRWSKAYGGDFSHDPIPYLEKQLGSVQVQEYLGGFRYIATATMP